MDDEGSVRALDLMWNQVYQENRRELFEQILADDFQAIFLDGHAVGKAEMMERTERREVAFSEHRLDVFGATASAKGRALFEHPEGSKDQRFIRIYTKREGRWWAVAAYAFPIECQVNP